MDSTDRDGIKRARALRKQMSYPEVLLWLELKDRPGGHKIRKQHGIGKYTFDFYCDEAKLCIEVDGIAHDMGDRPQRDHARDEWVRMLGVETLRIPANMVLKERALAIEAIVAKCDERVALLKS